MTTKNILIRSPSQETVLRNGSSRDFLGLRISDIKKHTHITLQILLHF